MLHILGNNNFQRAWYDVSLGFGIGQEIQCLLYALFDFVLIIL